MNMQLINNKARGLENTFYIVDLSTPENSWWQLRLVDTHQVISTNKTKEGILDSIFKMTKRYKTRSVILKVMKATDYQLNDITLVQRKEEYTQFQHLLDEVEETVRQAVDKANEVRKPMKPILKDKALVKKETKPLPKKTNTETKTSITPIKKAIKPFKPLKKLTPKTF